MDGNDRRERFWEAYEALQLRKDALQGKDVGLLEPAEVLLDWIREECGGDRELASSVLQLDNALVKARFSPEERLQARALETALADVLGGWFDREAEPFSEPDLPEALGSASDALAYAEYYLSLAVRPEDLRPWHRYEAADLILDALFGAVGRDALAGSLRRVAAGPTGRRTEAFPNGEAAFEAAIQSLAEAFARREKRRVFRAVRCPAESAGLAELREEQRVMLAAAYQVERDSGWEWKVAAMGCADPGVEGTERRSAPDPEN